MDITGTSDDYGERIICSEGCQFASQCAFIRVGEPCPSMAEVRAMAADIGVSAADIFRQRLASASSIT